MAAGHKEGYLTKRGKNFGGWKTRYFVLSGPILEYYDTVCSGLCSPEDNSLINAKSVVALILDPFWLPELRLGVSNVPKD